MGKGIAIAVTGLGLEIPGWIPPSPLSPLQEVPYGEFDAQAVLGKKGLRYKDRATLLALCAAQRALADRGLLDAPPEERAGMGVCVSSNLGNMDTVCRESEVIRREHVDSTSPMSLPVASSNVIPAGIAIRHGFKGINLMLCNGSTSGLDAVHIAVRMLQSGRATRMVVVGVEPRHEASERLLRECDPDNPGGGRFPAGDLAAALILEPLAKHSGRSHGVIGEYGSVPPGAAATGLPHGADVWFAPSQNSPRSRDFTRTMKENGFAGVPMVDASRFTGELYGALGVFQILMAVHHLRESGGKRALATNGLTFGDGLSYLQISV